LRSTLSASIRAFIRASSSFSSSFFFLIASLAAFCTSDVDDVVCGVGDVAFCLPFALEEGGGVGAEDEAWGISVGGVG
jgi:hypothetical protein